MKLLSDALDEKKFDVRMVQKNMGRALTSHKDYVASLKSLEDVSANMEIINLDTIEKSHDGNIKPLVRPGQGHKPRRRFGK